MIISTDYPRNEKKSRFRKARCLVLSSSICSNREKMNECNVELHYQKKINLKSLTLRKKNYLTEEELRLFYIDIIKYYLPDVYIRNISIIEDKPSTHPEVRLIINSIA